MLTASHTLADADGLGTITYHWLRGGVDTGATGSTYLLGDADVGAQISVRANYTDGHGAVEAVTSAATAAVANVNDAPTGTVTISGVAQEGQVLTASNTLADADGLGTIGYQWQRDGADVVGATGTTYTLGNADVGHTIDVVASYTDGHGTLESEASAATPPVAGTGVIIGDDNNNTLVGSDGNDSFQGFAGNDTLNGTAGQDLAIYTDATAAVTINLAAGTVAATSADASIGTDTLRSIELVQGSNFDDTYIATGYWTGVGVTSANQASPSLAGPVNNTFEGMGGDDFITGNGRTTASYIHAAAGVTVNLSSGATNGSATSTAGGDAAAIGSDTLINVNWVRGSEFADVLNGGTGAQNDVFTGGPATTPSTAATVSTSQSMRPDSIPLRRLRASLSQW